MGLGEIRVDLEKYQDKFAGECKTRNDPSPDTCEYTNWRECKAHDTECVWRGLAGFFFARAGGSAATLTSLLATSKEIVTPSPAATMPMASLKAGVL